MTEESLKNKTVRGVVWSAIDAFLGQGVTFIIGLVLARLLSPPEYGLIGICLIFTTVLNGIVDSGFSNALIRKDQLSNEDLNTMFITNMCISLILYLVLFGSSYWISVFFQRPELTNLIRVSGIVLICNAFSIVQVTNLTKKLDFKTKAKASLISAILSGVIGLILAYLNFGVWALVAQLVSKQLLYTVSLWWFNHYYPSLEFNINSFRYMWGFGWKLMFSGLLNNIWNQLYQVVVGKFYSPYSLGQYTRSNEYANLLSSNITAIVQRVSYPVLAEIKNDRDRMVSAYRIVIKSTMLVTCTGMLFMGAVSEPLIYCLIGPQWKEAALYLPLICLNMSLFPLHAINLNMLQIQGRSDIFLYLEIIKKVISLLPLAIGIFVNIYSMLLCSFVCGIFCFFLNSYYTGRKLGYSSWMQIKDILPDYAVAICVAGAVFFIKYIPISFWIILPIQILLGLSVFSIVCHFARLKEFNDILGIVSSLLKKYIIKR